MNEWYEQAKAKLAKEKTEGNYNRYAEAMKASVCEALESFCNQDAEFAQAVAQGKPFADCMAAVAKGCGNSISDLEAYRRAVQFYFAGAEVQFQMSVVLCPAEHEEEQPQKPARKILSLADFL